MTRLLNFGRNSTLGCNLPTELVMRKSSGLLVLLLLAGTGSASLYAMPRDWVASLGRISGLSSADAQHLSVDSGAALEAARKAELAKQPRVFSPTTPLVETAETSANKAIRLAQVPTRPVEPPARPSFVAPLSAEGARRLASSKPGDDDARRELTRDLQKELKRVGCFEGDITGMWSPASKKAMSAFMDRVNATLPVEDPDYILLTLVQGHAAQACGKGCPTGQGLSNDGRCLPRAILAQSARKTDDRKLVDRVEKRPVEAKTAENRPADPIQTGTLAKPQVPAASSWTTATVVPTEPLPGRMAMGAPVPNPDESAKLDDIEARKRRAQAALLEEQKNQAKAQAEADRLKAERLVGETQRREQQIKVQALAQAEAEKQKAERLTGDVDRRERQVAAADARRSAQRQAEALETDASQSVGVDDRAKVAALATAAVAAKEVSTARDAAAERRVVLRRAREAREREEERNEQRAAAARDRERRSAAASLQNARPVPRYVPTVTVARAAPPPTPRPKPEQRWTRTFFSDITRSR
jgi:hypothetical protein